MSLLITPALDLSGATNPVLSYNEQTDWASYAETQAVLYSTDYNAEMVDPLNEATWVTLNDVISEEDVWVSQSFALPTESSVAVVFLYTGYDGSEWHLDDVSIAEDVGLSIGENDSLDMVIYPNPVDGDYVTIQTPLNGDKLVEVFDVNGRKVMERLLTTDTLNVSSISAGMYIVKVTVEDQSNVSKLIIE